MYIMIALTIFREYPKETRMNHMSDDTTTQSATQNQHSQPLSWQGCELLFDNLLLVFLLMLMTPSIASLAVIYLLVKYVAQRAGIGINAGRIRGINSKIRGGEVQHTGVVLSSKSLNQLSDAVHRMEFVVDQQLSTSNLAPRDPKTSSFSRITKVQKTIA